MSTLAAAARPTILFVVAYALNTTPHEAFHALTAYWLGFNSTIFQMWVNPDIASATPAQLATIAAAGPIFSLTLGVLCLLLYAHLRLRPSGLWFFMLAFVGIVCFLGPLAGAHFGGDFQTALALLGAPGWVTAVVSVAGWLFLVAFTFLMGRELPRWSPPHFSRAAAVISTAVAPATAGTFLILILYWPLPQSLVVSTIAGTFFWIPATMGVFVGFDRPRPMRALPVFTCEDAVVAIAAIAMIRIFATGVRLGH